MDVTIGPDRRRATDTPRRLPLALVAIVATGAIAVSMTAPVSAAVARWASPTGTGDLCTEAQPCSLPIALELAPEGSTVNIPAGEGNFKVSEQIDTALDLRIRGVGGRPTLVLKGSMNVNQSELSNVRVVANLPSTALRLYSTRANRILVHQTGTGHACFMGPEAELMNSICWADGNSDRAVETDGTVILRNVIAFGGTDAAIKSYGRNEVCSCEVATVTMVNVIAWSDQTANDLDLESDGTAALVVEPVNSNFRTVQISGDDETVTLEPHASNQTAAGMRPVMINKAAGNFRAKASSPTINKGRTSIGNGTEDFDGRQRTFGQKTDIGASEYSPPETSITHHPPSPSTGDQARWRFVSSRPGSTFMCRIDSGVWFVCTSPWNTPVTGGKHTFRVRATDPLGYVDMSPAVREFRIVAG